MSSRSICQICDSSFCHSERLASLATRSWIHSANYALRWPTRMETAETRLSTDILASVPQNNLPKSPFLYPFLRFHPSHSLQPRAHSIPSCITFPPCFEHSFRVHSHHRHKIGERTFCSPRKPSLVAEERQFVVFIPILNSSFRETLNSSFRVAKLITDVTALRAPVAPVRIRGREETLKHNHSVAPTLGGSRRRGRQKKEWK